SDETAAILKLPSERQIEGFYHCWTAKEAYVKATGEGLSLALDSFCVGVDPDQPASLETINGQRDVTRQWTVLGLDVAKGYAATVMIARPDCTFELWDWVCPAIPNDD